MVHANVVGVRTVSVERNAAVVIFKRNIKAVLLGEAMVRMAKKPIRFMGYQIAQKNRRRRKIDSPIKSLTFIASFIFTLLLDTLISSFWE
jgi:hypothetical protein